MKKIFIVLIILIMLTSCGYKNQIEQAYMGESIKIPEIKSDIVSSLIYIEKDELNKYGEIQEIIDSLSLYDKVCQMIIVLPNQLNNGYTTYSINETISENLVKYPVGGIFLNSANMQSKDQLQSLILNLQARSNLPLIVTCDEEGGSVTRVMRAFNSYQMNSMLSYSDKGPETAFNNAVTIGRNLRDVHINIDLAPVADVWSNPSNTVIGNRAYSRDFKTAAELIEGAVLGFHSAGVACTLKHFPGHGDTYGDSHYSTVYVNKTLDELREQEFLPFKAGIDAGADAVMIGHITVPSIDSKPATISYEIITGILRDELGFNGVVITDSLQMQALAGNYSEEDIIIESILAGNDLLLCPRDLDKTVSIIMKAIEDRIITEERIDESIYRIIEMKINMSLSKKYTF